MAILSAMVYMTALVFVAEVAVCLAKPLQNDNYGQEPSAGLPRYYEDEFEPVAGTFEQDMILTPLQERAIRNDIKRRRAGLGTRTRTVVSDGRYYWPRRIIPYQIAGDVGPTLKAWIRSAVEAWENKTCVRFQPKSQSLMTSLGHNDYVFINERRRGCAANVGHSHMGQQFVNISQQCSKGRIIHELGHAIGFIHEQSRPDRDQFVHINKANVQTGKLGQFEVYSRKEVTSFQLPYDIGSIMHYSSTAFSIDRQSPTITADDPYVQPWMGQRDDVSFLDAKLTNLAYLCNAHCSSSLTCNHEGYIGPSCACICPPGLSGPTCDSVIVTQAGCGGVLSAFSGIIQSPNYPNSYNLNEECSWLIKAPPSRTIHLTVEDFNVENAAKCHADFLEVKVHGYSTVGQKYCGGLNRGFKIIDHKQGEDLLVRFVSDRGYAESGFRINYQIN